MARQFSEEERQRMERGGQWLRAERRRRGFEHGTDFAAAIGIRQVRLSAYERGLYPIPEDIARRIAKALDLDEVTTWRELCLPLPAEFRTDEEAIAYVERRFPGLIDRVLSGDRPGDKPRPAGRKPRDVTQSGDPGPGLAQTGGTGA